MLNKHQAGALQQLMQDPKFEVIEQFIGLLIDKHQLGNVIGASDFETLKLTFQKEYKVEALRELLELMEQEAGSV